MTRHALDIVLVQGVTLSRPALTLFFAMIALTPRHQALAICVFIVASATDLIDGRLARRLGLTSPGGGALDLFGDKFLTVASALYAAARGVDLLPCSLIVLRETFICCMRSVHIGGQSVIPPTRFVGAVTATVIRCATLLLLLVPVGEPRGSSLLSFDSFFWFAGIIYVISLAYRVAANWKTIRRAFTVDN